MENVKKIHFNSNLLILRKKFLLSQIELANNLDIKRTTITNYELGNSTPDYDKLVLIANYFNVSIDDLLLSDLSHENTSVLNEPPANLIKLKWIPLIPHHAIAGLGSGELVIHESDIEQRYIVPEFSKADYLIRVKGSSMYPKYSAGDVLACVKMDKTKFIQWNKTYVLDTTQGIMVKRIIKGISKKDWILRSDNKDYDDIDVTVDNDVHHISLVIGVIRLE
jgi:phage repressor protein C with HTH and peptisase S24 domain